MRRDTEIDHLPNLNDQGTIPVVLVGHRMALNRVYPDYRDPHVRPIR